MPLKLWQDWILSSEFFNFWNGVHKIWLYCCFISYCKIWDLLCILRFLKLVTCSVYNVHSVSTDLSICLEGLSSVFDVQAYSLTPLNKEFQQCVFYQCNWLKSVNAQCKSFHAIYIKQIILNTLQFFYKNTIIPLVFVLLFFFPLLWWLSSQWINSKGKIIWENLCSLPTAVWSWHCNMVCFIPLSTLDLDGLRGESAIFPYAK